MMSVRLAQLALVCPFALMAPAAAQEAANPVGQSDTQDQGEILVTAQLREQSPAEVPFALTAYQGKFLDDLGITELDRLSRFVPGFEVQNQSPNNPGFVIRGITSDSGAAFNEPRVSVFQDGVSISKSRGSYVELFDLERVEIAKGPQSTLYGRGALIGAVNLVQAKADTRHGYGYAYGEFGNYGNYRFDQTVNLPLGGDLGLRIASRFKERDGYVDNLLGGEDFGGIKSEAVRGSLRWAPGALTVDLIGNYQHDRASGVAFKSIGYVPTDPQTGAVIGDRQPGSGAALAAPADFEKGRGLGVDRDVWGVTGIVGYDLGSRLSLNATGSYREFAGTEVFDADGISLPLLAAAEDAQGDQTTATVRLTWSDKGRLTAFIGGTYYRENGLQRTPAQFDERVALARLTGTLNGGGLIPGRPGSDPAPLALFGNSAFTGALLQGALTSALGQAGLSPAEVSAASAALLPTALAQGIAANLKPAHLESATNLARTESWDLYADATLNVTDRFEIGGGIRYSRDDKRTGYQSAVLNGRSVLGGFIGALSVLPTSPATSASLLAALAVPGAADIPASAAFPVPMFGLSLQPTGANGTRFERSLRDEGLTWRAVARYEWSPHASVYANYARGRRPEVLSVAPPALPGGAAEFAILPAETVDSVELGAKTDFANRTLFLDVAGFYYAYSNFQTTQQQGTSLITVNAGHAESYGAEAQLRWNPADWLGVFGTYAYNHSRFLGGARAGNRFRLSPDHSASLGLALRAPAGPVRIDFTPSVTWQSRIFFDDDNDRAELQLTNLVADLAQDELQGSYALIDARFGLETANGRWRVEAFATNLLGQRYIKDAGNTGDTLGMPTFIAGEPRLYGMALSLKLGQR